MTRDQAPRQKQQDLDNLGKAKKVYQKPAFRYERVFETIALSCGKLVHDTRHQCNLSKKTS
ncbi:MAG: hypothetical protein LAO23_12680 [Acidobacteriia bacterium]|nr:hypothetical protein [Terriglobia bacterium]